MDNKRIIAVANRRTALKDKLEKNPGVMFSYDQIMDEFSLSYYMLRTDIHALKEADANVVMNDGKIYYNIEDTPIIHEVQKPERYGSMQNTDGLSDPTAGFALKNLEPDTPRGMIFPKSGDVWDVKRANTQDTEKYTVLAVNKDKQVATCIKYSKDELVDTCDICLFTKPLKYFVGTNRCWTMPLSYMTRVKERIGKYLDIPVAVVVKEVEKVVEKEVPAAPAPVEAKVSTGLYTQAEVDLMLMKQKAEIYEKCFGLIASK